jgi:hypothetical protein
MAKLAKQQRSFSKYFASFNVPRRLLVLLGVAIFAGVGAYIVFFANANNNPGHATYDDKIGDYGFVWPDAASIPTMDASEVGATKTRTLYAQVPPTSWLEQPTGRIHLTITVGDGEGSYQNPPGYSCNPSVTCVATARRQDYGAGKRDFSICADVPVSLYGQQIGLLAFQSLIHGFPYNYGGLNLSYSWSEGTCFAPTGNLLYAVQAIDWSTGGHSGVWATGEAYGPDVSSGPGPSQGPDKDGANPASIPGDSNGPTLNSGPGGGGGGGSSANTQSNNPNTVPTSSPQGDSSQQSESNPSPFYDGKQYEPGSDSDILGANTTFSVAGYNLKYGWLYVGVLLLITGGGYYVWRHPDLIRKLKKYIGLH